NIYRDSSFFFLLLRPPPASPLFPYTTLFRSFAALFFGANVAPDERGANDIPAFIDKDRAVHLAGEANTGDVFASEIRARQRFARSEEHTSELQSRGHLVCRLLLEKKKTLLTA